ncbi:MAG: glycerol-3-phosphate 1-O-acyltransferase PlsY [Clostridia bacterium]|nr:glycerol-3-phosphate 1-O-acyltransferase PlsY [Clostridia bacterium]
MAIRYILAAVIGYLLGSVSTGVLVSRLTGGPNLYEVGSKSTGASNALRSMGVKRGVITFVGDILKALAACLIGLWLTGGFDGGPRWGALIAGLAVVIGHNWPCFFGFKGGKGVASSTAVMLVCYPIPALIGYAIAILAIAITRWISLGSILMLVSYAVMVCVGWAEGNPWVIAWAIVLAALCLIRHHANIGRLLRGEERKIGQKLSDEKK